MTELNVYCWQPRTKIDAKECGLFFFSGTIPTHFTVFNHHTMYNRKVCWLSVACHSKIHRKLYRKTEFNDSGMIINIILAYRSKFWRRHREHINCHYYSYFKEEFSHSRQVFICSTAFRFILPLLALGSWYQCTLA